MKKIKKLNLEELVNPNSPFRKAITESWVEYIKSKEENKEKVKKVV